MPDLTPLQRQARVRTCIFRTFKALMDLEDGLGFLDRGDPIYANAMVRHYAFQACQDTFPDDIVHEAASRLQVCLQYKAPAMAKTSLTEGVSR